MFRLRRRDRRDRRRHRARVDGCARGVRPARRLGRDREPRRPSRGADAGRDAPQGARPARARDTLAAAEPAASARHRRDDLALRPVDRGASPRSPERRSRAADRKASRRTARELTEAGVPASTGCAHRLARLAPADTRPRRGRCGDRSELRRGDRRLLRDRRPPRAPHAARADRRPAAGRAMGCARASRVAGGPADGAPGADDRGPALRATARSSSGSAPGWS